MSKSMLERVMEAKKEHEVAQVIFFNTGKVKTENNGFAQFMKNIDHTKRMRDIEGVLCNAADCYGRNYEYDTLNMQLELGLIYDVKDVDQTTNRIKHGAKPVDNVVRFYIGSINCFKDGEKTNVFDYGEIAPTKQGYIHFDKLVSTLEGSGLDYNGPKMFDDLKDKILSGEHFDISLTADLNEKKEVTPEKEDIKEEPKQLAKRHFFRR